MQENSARRCWRIAFATYGVLSLSSMAGMGIGSGLYALTTFVFLAATWRVEGRSILKEAFSSPYSWLSLALFLACLLSLVAAVLFPVDGTQEGPRFASLKKFHYFLLPPLIAAGFLYSGKKNREPERHPLWNAWGAMGAVLGVIAMVQFFGADLFPADWLKSTFFRAVGDTNRYHGQGLMFFHLSFASCMCFVASAALARVFFPLAGDVRRTRALWALAAALASAGVFFSYSRIAFLALALVALALSFLRKPLWGLAACVALAVTGPLIWIASPSLQTRFYVTRSGNLERFAMWRSGWAMFESRPLTGVGFSRTGEISPWIVKNVLKEYMWFTSHAHNNILDMLGATGAIGFLAFLLWWGFLFWAAARAFLRAPLERRWLPAAALTGLLTFQINGLTQVNFWDGKSEHTLMLWVGVVLALYLAEKKTVKT